MKGLVLIISYVALLTSIFPENNIKDYEKAKSLTQLGISYLLNFEFDKSNELCDEVIQNYPDYPQPYISKSALPMWKFLLSKSTDDYKQASKLIDNAIRVAEKYLEKNKKNPQALTHLGIAYGNRVFIKLRNENYLGMIIDLRKSYSALREAVMVNPEYYDAYMGLGIYHYSIGSLPKALKWIVSLLGFEGNAEKGLKEIELVAEKGNFQKVEAAFYLTQFYPWLYGDFEKAIKIISELLSQYPKNQIFLYTRSVFNLNKNNVEDALKDLLTIQNQNFQPIPKLSSFSKYRLGECYFRLGNYTRAIEFYKEFIKDYKEEFYLPQALLNIGIWLEFNKKRDEAVEFYSKAINSKSNYGDDLFAIERAKKFRNQKIGEFDSLLIVAKNLHKSGKYSEAEYLYNVKLINQSSDSNSEAEIYYFLGECYYDASKFNEAKSVFEKVLNIKEKTSPWIDPWAKFYLGQIYLKNKDERLARKFFSEVLNYKNYHNERWLKYRAERSLKLIK